MTKMTIKQCMDAALQLLNQYSIAGAIVPLSYNDQADDINRMINLINDAQMELAITVKPITETVTFEVPEADRNAVLTDVRFELPEDYFRFESIRFTPASGGRAIDADFVKVVSGAMLMPSRPAGTYTVEYNRYPVRYEPNVDTLTELDNTPDTHEAIPYYVASMIAIDENPKLYYAMYNVWETRLARMGEKTAHAVNNGNINVYDFDVYGGIW